MNDSQRLIKHSHENRACSFLSEYLVLAAAGCPTLPADNFGKELCSGHPVDWNFL